MSQWYISEFSKLIGLLKRTLYHYDKEGLLKASFRLSNGYRVYNNNDLLQLKRITVLKFFGFELVMIKDLLGNSNDISILLTNQLSVLDQKIKIFSQKKRILADAIAELTKNKDSFWDDLCETISANTKK